MQDRPAVKFMYRLCPRRGKILCNVAWNLSLPNLKNDIKQISLILTPGHGCFKAMFITSMTFAKLQIMLVVITLLKGPSLIFTEHVHCYTGEQYY